TRRSASRGDARAAIPDDGLEPVGSQGCTGTLPDGQLRRGYLNKMDQRRRIDSEPDQRQGQHRERRAASPWDRTGILGSTFGIRRGYRNDNTQVVEQADDASDEESNDRWPHRS